MSHSTYDPLREGIQSDLYEEARKQDEAYHLLRRGLARYEQTARLLDLSDLQVIRPFQEKLVLSSQERWLLKHSEEVRQKEKKRKQQQTRGILFFFCILLLLIFQSWRWLYFREEAKLAAVPSVVQAIEAVEKSAPAKAPPADARSPSAVREKLPAAHKNKAVVLPEVEPPAPEEVAAPNPRDQFSVVIPVQARGGVVWRVRKAGKWGLASPEGKVLLPLKFRRVRVLQTDPGYFILEDGSRRGIANAAGRILLAPVYDGFGTFYEEEAMLIVSQGKRSGVFDLRNEQMVIEPVFEAVHSFSEGLFGIQTTQGKWGFADVAGEVVIPPAYDAIVKPFQKGRALIVLDSAEYYIDREGEVLASRQ